MMGATWKLEVADMPFPKGKSELAEPDTTTDPSCRLGGESIRSKMCHTLINHEQELYECAL
jgi:hypothetical protein